MILRRTTQKIEQGTTETMFSSIKFEEGVRRTQSFRTTANVKKEEAVSKIDLSTEKEQKKREMNSTRIPSGKATKPNEIFSARQAANFLTLNVNNYSRSRCCINNRPYSIVETQSYWLLQKINRGRNTSNTKYGGTRDKHWSYLRRNTRKCLLQPSLFLYFEFYF